MLYAERFEFTFSDFFYKQNVNVDEFGERLHIDTKDYARIVSREGLLLDDDIEVDPEEEEIVDEEGNVVVKKKPVPVIPVNDLYNVNYF